MVAGLHTHSKRSTRVYADRRHDCAGFTMIEILVALVVTVLITGAALSVALSSHESYVTDQNRTEINQSLRGGLDLVGIELRQAGERLPFDFPAIEVVDGDAGAPDTLIVRRNLLDEVLPLCAPLDAGSTTDEVRVADSGDDPAQGCDPLTDDDGNNWPDNLDAWRAYRDANGGQVRAFVFNPVTRAGDWFLFDGDGSTPDHLARGDDEPWNQQYDIAQQCRVYLLEERRYRIDANGLLQYVVNGNFDNPVNLSSDIADFQLRAFMTDGSVVDLLDPTANWTALRSIEVSLVGQTEFSGRSMTRRTSSRFFPRNVLSN